MQVLLTIKVFTEEVEIAIGCNVMELLMHLIQVIHINVFLSLHLSVLNNILFSLLCIYTEPINAF